MKILIVSHDNKESSASIKKKIEIIAGHHQCIEIGIDQIKFFLSYDIVITPKDLLKRVQGFYPSNKIRLVESFQVSIVSAVEEWLQGSSK